MKTWSFDSPDPEATLRLAAELGRSIAEAGLALALTGPLGSGKTVFVKGVATGLGIDPALVSSPTFVIAQQYPIGIAEQTGPLVLHHVDLYRLESDLELESIGFFDMIRPGAVVAVEWADRFPDVLGPDRLEIAFDGPAPVHLEAGTGAPRRGRSARVEAHGAVAEAVLDDWCERVDRADRVLLAAAGEGVGRGPRRPVAWVLAWAIVLWGIAGREPGEADPTCVDARPISADDWGTRSVACNGLAESSTPLTGIGGLLFGTPLDLESVSAVQLEALPGIGPSRARAIVAARDVAPFERLQDLERITGIGPKTRARISDWVEVRATEAGTANAREAGAERSGVGGTRAGGPEGG